MTTLQKIENAIKSAEKKLTGPLGVGFTDLSNPTSVYLNGSMLFPTASVFKIFILVELYNQCSKGFHNLNDRIELTEEIKSPGSGVLYQLSNGTSYTLYDYAYLMMALSDNTAADLLYYLVEPQNIYKNVLMPLGLRDTKIDLDLKEMFKCYVNADPKKTPEEQYKDYYTGDFLNNDYYKCTQEKNDVTTPSDINKLLQTIYTADYCSAEMSEQIQALMKKCQTNSRIPKYLPGGTAVAHKTGTFDRLVCDAGIVYTDEGDYILSMFYNGNLANPDEYYNRNMHGYFGDEVLAHLSKEIFEIYTKNNE